MSEQIVSEQSWTTPDLYDEHGVDEGADALRVLAPGFVSYGGHESFSGPVETVRCREDNSRVKEQLATPGEGRVLVVDGGGSTWCALLGDLIGESAVEHGWAGVVIHGAVRDVEALRELPIGIRALASVPRKSTRRGDGLVGVDVSFAGVTISSGDHLYADATGIVVSTHPLT